MTFNLFSPLNLERFTNLFQSLKDSLYTELVEISSHFLKDILKAMMKYG
jgi:hypothetical protein